MIRAWPGGATASCGCARAGSRRRSRRADERFQSNAVAGMSFVSAAPRTRWIPLRLALRELRSGLRGFYVFIACIALGVMAIAGVGAVATSLDRRLAREATVIRGGHLSFNPSHREVPEPERPFLESQGRISAAAMLRATARAADGRTALIELKAVDAAYPLYGAASLDPAGPLPAALAHAQGVFGAAADPALLAPPRPPPGSPVPVQPP